jgi:hypothetical protein
LTKCFLVYKRLAPGANGNLTTHGKGPSNWLAGIDIDAFNGATIGERVARAAASIKADYLSTVATSVGERGLHLLEYVLIKIFLQVRLPQRGSGQCRLDSLHKQDDG